MARRRETNAEVSSESSVEQRLAMYLASNNIKGIDGVVGDYDENVISDACQSIIGGSHTVDVYGTSISSQLFECLGLL